MLGSMVDGGCHYECLKPLKVDYLAAVHCFARGALWHRPTMLVQRMLGLLNVGQPASLSVAVRGLHSGAFAVRGLLEADTAEPPPPPRALLPPPEAAPAQSVGAGQAEEWSPGGYATADVGAKRKAEEAAPEEPPALRRVRALAAEECTQVSPSEAK